MRKHLFFYSLIFSSLLFASSCRKCVQCTEYTAAGIKEIEYRETCGKNNEIEDYRIYQENNVNPGNKVKCEERKTTLF
jgi:putative component of membrane protein insertase Oxa1/YidC/SpoIIIJ protein YidD